ncbi:Aldo/keto reductase [Lachnospiraceae bacterium NE2001]|nr:Aldo/keto reductase [Lachnospiraceae bacterium NE2001]
MKEVTLSNNVNIPMVGYGSYLSTENGGKQVILDALETGYRYIDTASYYYNEDAIGEAILESGILREDIFICSKVWPTMLGLEETRESFEESCRKLQTDYLDMFLIHWPKVSQSDERWLDKIIEGWKAMEELYDEGRIKAIGVSNFLPHHLRPLLEAARIKPMVDQLELHVGYMQEYTLSYLKKEGIVPQAWSPLGRARMLSDERIIKLADKYGKSPAQVLISFLIKRGIPVIPKASSKERMLQNLDVFDFDLNEDEISYLSCIPQAGWSEEHPDLFED